MPGKTYVYSFAAAETKDKMLLGGKGANLAVMTSIGLPVPPGLTITTEACNEYLASGGEFPSGLEAQLREKLQGGTEKKHMRFDHGEFTSAMGAEHFPEQSGMEDWTEVDEDGAVPEPDQHPDEEGNS